MIPPKILKALNHVREFFPNVSMVVFNIETRWCYMDDDFNAPSFNGFEIDQSILEDAVYDVTTLPCVFQLPD